MASFEAVAVTGVLLRNIIGFLVQMVPCALLCLIPFGTRFRGGARRAWGLAALIVAVGLVPFLAVAVMPLMCAPSTSPAASSCRST